MSISDKIKQKIVKYLGVVIAAMLLNTLKADKSQVNFARNLSKNGKNVIYAFWHSNILIPGYFLRNLGIQVLVSQHRDGEYIAGVVSLLGFGTVRGSTTRGGARAMIKLTKKALTGHSIAITPDGPRGPRRITQPGIVFLARKTGFPIIPIAAKISRYWELPSWDRFVVPKPFAKVTLAFGEPIHVSRNISDKQVKQYCRAIEKDLNSQDSQ